MQHRAAARCTCCQAGVLGTEAAGPADGFSAYVSDPAKPVPFIQRPIHLLADGEGAGLGELAGERSARGFHPAGCI